MKASFPNMQIPFGDGVDGLDRSDAADAARFRWMLQGNGYFFEENQLCGPASTDAADADEGRREIDAAMAGTR
jgi:hypothetical protein